MNENKKNTDNYDFEYNLILLGDSSVGKTCLFKKLTTGFFKEKNVSTIGIDKKTFELKCDIEENEGTVSSKIVKVNLTDTAGQERYRALTRAYYKNSDAAIILYDITEQQTYDNIGMWINNINESINTDKDKYTMFLLGTKIDLVTTGKKEEKEEKDEFKKPQKFQIDEKAKVNNAKVIGKAGKINKIKKMDFNFDFDSFNDVNFSDFTKKDEENDNNDNKKDEEEDDFKQKEKEKEKEKELEDEGYNKSYNIKISKKELNKKLANKKAISSEDYAALEEDNTENKVVKDRIKSGGGKSAKIPLTMV